MAINAGQELAMMSDDIAEVGAEAPRTVAARALRPVAAALGAAAIFGIGYASGQSGQAGLSLASLRGAAGLETSAELEVYKTMQADAFEKYSGYTGTFSAAGIVTMHNADTPNEDFVWILKVSGEDSSKCTNATGASLPENACTMQITQGEDCKDPTGNILVGAGPKSFNPYSSLVCLATELFGVNTCQNAQKDVQTGLTGTQLNGHTLILFDDQGNRAMCSPIVKSPLSDLPGGVCFPADASATVQGRGDVSLADLAAGDSVLVQRPSGELAFEPLLGFLHATKGFSRFVAVQHEGGELRASANHLVFLAGGATKLAGDLRAGDVVMLAGASASEAAPSVVLSARVASSEAGMVAPLTASGSIVVDGAVASAYATHSATSFIPHGALHALFFPARLLARASLGTVSTGPSPSLAATDALHPLANFYAQALIPVAKALAL